ncbi:hypothetical protein [Pseudoalteromonas sp.]|uniref:hypothetical protein n=1 Tax=Pseudoalteromonas sp. TaxID=53249 RepID=UPI00272A50E7|nr:hypothetical protein [Pseudoalteromonas sp.]
MSNIDNLINNASNQAQQQAQEQNMQHNMQQPHTNTQHNTQEYIPNNQGQNSQTYDQNSQGQVYDQGGAPQQNMQQQNPNMQQQNMPQNQNMQQQNMPQNQNMQQQNMPQNQNMQPNPNMQQQNMQQQNMQPNPNMQQQNPMMQQQNPMMQQQNQMMPQQNQMMQQQNQMMQQQNQMMQQQNQMMPQQGMQQNLPAHMQQYAMASDMSMESLDAMGLQVDHWLKPDFVGMTVGETPSIVEHIIAEIELTQNIGFVLGFGLRYGKNPPNYDFTPDGLTSSKTGGLWVNALAQATAVDPEVRPYRSAQLVFTALDTVKSQDGSLLVEVGETVGYTTPQSNWAEWSKFYRTCAKEGLLNTTVKVKLTNIPRTKDTNKWGVVKIELLKDAASQSAA